MDEYEKLKYNPQFLKKAYDLVKDDFPKLFKDDDDYTEEDEKNWNIALDKIYNNFVTPEEDDFIEIWGETDGTIGLIDYVHENENQFKSFEESSNKYVKAFREACKKIEENSEDELYYWLEDVEDIIDKLFPFVDQEHNKEFLIKFKELYPHLLYWIRTIYETFYGEDETYHNSNKPFETLSNDTIYDLYFTCYDWNRKLAYNPKLLAKKVNEAMKILTK